MKQDHSALIVIDMQADYIGEKSKYKYYPHAFIEKINERISLAKNRNELIIYVKNVGRYKKEPYVSDFVEGLVIASNCIVEKTKASVFHDPILLDILRENDITTIEIIGIDGNCCVAFSAIDASKLGFSVVFPLTYIGIKSKERFSTTKEKLLEANVQIIEPMEEACFK